jgi:hypothetical protein
MWPPFEYFGEYIRAFFSHWMWLLTSVPWLVDNIFKQPFRDAWQKLDQRIFISPKARHRLEVGIMLLGVFTAGFLAWWDKQEEAVALKKQTIELQA